MRVSPFLGQLPGNLAMGIIGLRQRARMPHAAAQFVAPAAERKDLAVRSS